VIKTESFDLLGRLCASFNEIERKSLFRLFSSLKCSDLKDNGKQIDFDKKNYWILTSIKEDFGTVERIEFHKRRLQFTIEDLMKMKDRLIYHFSTDIRE
jgi:hypothetical protein